MKWITETAWPFITGKAWPAVSSAYANHEGVRHVVTFMVGAFVGWVFL